MTKKWREAHPDVEPASVLLEDLMGGGLWEVDERRKMVTAYLVGSPGPYALILADTDVAAGAGHEAVMFNDAEVSPNQNYRLRFKAASGGSTSSKLRLTVSKFADAAGTIPGGPSQTQDFTIASPSSGQITLPFSTGPSDVRVRVSFVRDRIYTDKSMLSLDDVAITCN